MKDPLWLEKKFLTELENELKLKGEMIKPIGNRILVKLLPRYDGISEKLNLTIVDKKKHYDGVRRGRVECVADGVKSVSAGDIVLFSGEAGESFGMDERGVNDGTEWRRLRVSDILAFEEKEEAVA